MVNGHPLYTVNVRAVEDASKEARTTATESILILVLYWKARLAYPEEIYQYLYAEDSQYLSTRMERLVETLGSRNLV